MRDALLVTLLSAVPRNRVARAMGRVARSTGLAPWLTRAFVWAYGVDLSQADPPDRAAYPTLDALFTRRLVPGARPVDPDPTALVSPVDGTVAFVGQAEQGQVPVAPGRTLHLQRLLGTGGPPPDDADATSPSDGSPLLDRADVVVLYLSPTDYHRVHTPLAATATARQHLPGTLWPVFPAAVRAIDGLFGRNERVVVTLDEPAGPRHHVVLVGAFGVGHIRLDIDPTVGTNHPTHPGDPHPIPLSPPVPLKPGDPLGVFHLGSTVVVVSPPGTWSPTVAEGQAVRVGQCLGRRGSGRAG